MIDIQNMIRKDLQDFVPYQAKVAPHTIKLDANESPFDLSENVRKNLIAYLETEEALNRYPDTNSDELRAALATYYDIQMENIICGVGSDQIIDIITKVFLNVGEKVAVLPPTFSMYGISTRLNHGQVVEIPLEDGFEVSPQRVIQECNRNDIKILMLCTPNNPTGNTLSQETLRQIIEGVGCIVVVDEAYGEFAENAMIPFINQYNNLVVLKTFSKAFGLAGLRVGYAVGNPQLIQALYLAKPPYNLSVLSERIAIEVLKDCEVYKQRIAELNESRAFLLTELQTFPFLQVYPSEANFVLMDSTIPLTQRLASQGVLIRKMKDNPAEGFVERLRITAGSMGENKTLMVLLNTIFNEVIR